jgi:5-methylcytosine-specific restriction endonuclease McrA
VSKINSIYEKTQKGRILSNGEVIGKSLKHFVERKDPVKRAERAEARRAKKQKVGAPLLSQDDFSDIEITYGRENMIAAQINAALARDKGCCTHIGSDGKRCGQDRWVDVHHIVSIADGGSNHPSNLTTLCSFHHDMVHQLNLPMEGAFNHLRSSQRPYSIHEETNWESKQLQRLQELWQNDRLTAIHKFEQRSFAETIRKAWNS